MKPEIRLSRELLPPGSRVLCAVSGGADSVCLLHLALGLGDVDVACAHFDHALRSESASDAAFVAGLCRQWGVPFFTERGDAAAHARRTGQSVETAARELRYAFLERAADAWGAHVIATAHNREDNAETVLFHMARGTGLRGLTGIPERRGRLVRPLLHVSRAQIEAYLAAREIPHVEDATNALDDCARNYARHHVLPALEKLHGGAAENLDRMTVNLREDEAFLDSLAADWLAGQGEELSASGLLALPRPVARRALRDWLEEDLTRERFEAALDFCSGESAGRLQLPGRELYRRGGRLSQTPPDAARLTEREVRPGEELSLPEAGLRLSCRECSDSGEIQTSFNIFSFSCANICGKLTVGARRADDGIRFPGREGTHSVKKLLSERKIPPERRELVPVLRDEAGPLAVYGVGQSVRASARPGERFWRVVISEDKEE